MNCEKCPYKDENGDVLLCHCVACFYKQDNKIITCINNGFDNAEVCDYYKEEDNTIRQN